jgi:Holliday junction resolvase RusA-like endonuclease
MAHQSVRVTRTGRTYQPKKLSDYKEAIRQAVQEQLPDGFLCIKADTEIHIKKLHYCYEFPKSFSKLKRESVTPNYKVTKPDLQDNLNKPLFDALEGLVWERDQNVVSIQNMRKIYWPENLIKITICWSY